MNLHQLVSTSITSINPNQTITVRKYLSSTLNEYGISTNVYTDSTVKAQVQPISSYKLRHINNFNSSNTYQKVFLNGFQSGLSTPLDTNGDLLIIDSKTWLIIEAPQQWKYSGWNELTISLQV